MIDLVSKVIVVATVEPGADIRLFGGALYLTQLRNVGAAFSFAEGATVLFSLVAVVVAVVIVRTARRMYSTGWAVTLGSGPGRGARQPDRPDLPGPRIPARGRGRLPSVFGPDGQRLAGVQRGRLRDRLRRCPRCAAGAARHRVRRVRHKDQSPVDAT